MMSNAAIHAYASALRKSADILAALALLILGATMIALATLL